MSQVKGEKYLMKNNKDRRSFFLFLGKGALGAILLSSLPIKLFATSNKYKKLKKVVIHNQAVKRVK
ncbi:MAG: hypothetical protein COW71_15410 [Ignavibacteriales bacterium CG18_big_fil_WC_8_21_14_2_50_31_20]|nr:MAG: hypothetical protein COW71_15410 [Ignavibacteriales bacterium CG18_big_fil_WC_8_21_14_2_50_31_20]